ncbi:MAG: SulP family inorganic anion transporter [Betaproteobacteria bacterium]
MSAVTLNRWLPMLAWWPRVSPTTLRADAIAGLSGALIVLPQGIAYATIAGLPPEYGIYGAIVPAILGALFGSSWQLVTGPTASASIVVFASVSAVAAAHGGDIVQLALTLTLVVGLIKLVFACLNVGRVIEWVSDSVVIGFTAGAACLIASSQIGALLGYEQPRGLSFLQILKYAFGHAAETNPAVLVVAVITLVAAFVVRALSRKLPHMLLAMLIGGLAAALIEALLPEQRGAVRTIGELPSPVPPLSTPSFAFDLWRDLIFGASAIAVLGVTEAVSIARAFALRTGQKIDGNQEIFGQALANIGGAFTSGYLSSASFSRTAIHYEAGGQTPLANLFCAGFAMLLVIMVAALVAHLPVAAMAAILVYVAWGLIDRPRIAHAWRTSRREFAVLFLTFCASLLIQIEYAVFVGIALSLAFRYLEKRMQ